MSIGHTSQARRRGLGLAAALVAGAVFGAASPFAPAPDETFATVDGTAISYAAFYNALQDHAGVEVAERVILEQVLRAEATRLKLLPTAEQVEARIRELVNQQFGGNSGAMAAWLAQTGTDEAALRRRVTAELMDFAIRTREVEATDEKLKAWFDAHHAERYDRPETVRFRQIVMDTKEKADEVVKELAAGGVSFFSAAARYSADPEAKESGGLVGPESVSFLQQNAKPLAEALAGLKANEFSEKPFELAGKWYLVLLIERVAGRPTPFEPIKEQVRHDYLLDQAPAEEAFYAPMLQKAKIAGLPARYRALQAAMSGGQGGNMPLGPALEP